MQNKDLKDFLPAILLIVIVLFFISQCGGDSSHDGSRDPGLHMRGKAR